MIKLIRNLILAAAAVFLFLYFMGPAVVSKAVEQTLGTDVSVKKLHLKLFPAEAGIYGLKIHNLPGYTEPTLASIPEIFVRVNLLSVLSGRPRVEEIHLNVENVTLERSPGNKINLKEILDFSKQKEKKAGRPSSPSAPGTSSPESKKTAGALHIEEASISLGEVLFVFQEAGQKKVKKIPVHVDHLTLRNVTDISSLTEQIIFEVLKHIGVSALGIQMDIFSGDFKKEAEQLLQDAKGKLKQIFA